ncbi:hypothetical protein ACTMSW_29220 [Micromonospora sp. BQ11]|uniref:hypothetical protein n=1 Tax=Micromonospora sp. BQ11 TaxID=3452212 RepID=UPI003F8C6AD3
MFTVVRNLTVRVALAAALTVLTACSTVAGAERPGVRLSQAWLERAGAHTKDLIYPGPVYPATATPLDPDPVLYADAVWALAEAGQLSPAQREQATTLLVRWLPREQEGEGDPDGFLRLSVVRALMALNAIGRLSDDDRTATLQWAAVVLAAPDPANSPRRTAVAARLVNQLNHVNGFAGGADWSTLLRRAGTEMPCAGVDSVADAAVAAILAVVARQRCDISTEVRALAAARLTHTGPDAPAAVHIAVIADLWPLVAVQAVDPRAFADRMRWTLETLGRPEYARGGELGQGAILPVVEAAHATAMEVALPHVQTETLLRIVRSQGRLPDKVGHADVLDTAAAVHLLTHLDTPTPIVVTRDRPMKLVDRLALGLATGRGDSMPTEREAADSLGTHPASPVTLSYLASAYPRLCLQSMDETRKALAHDTSIGEWPVDRIFHAALLLSATQGCAYSEQKHLMDELRGALDAFLVGSTRSGDIVEIWYAAEAWCLLGRPSGHLPDRAELNRLLDQQVGLNEIDPGASVRQLYAALRLDEIVHDSDSNCQQAWWNSDRT